VHKVFTISAANPAMRTTATGRVIFQFRRGAREERCNDGGGPPGIAMPTRAPTRQPPSWPITIGHSRRNTSPASSGSSSSRASAEVASGGCTALPRSADTVMIVSRHYLCHGQPRLAASRCFHLFGSASSRARRRSSSSFWLRSAAFSARSSVVLLSSAWTASRLIPPRSTVLIASSVPPSPKAR
jgi:hypothetical protein